MKFSLNRYVEQGHHVERGNIGLRIYPQTESLNLPIRLPKSVIITALCLRLLCPPLLTLPIFLLMRRWRESPPRNGAA